jgi:hypothetical protein
MAYSIQEGIRELEEKLVSERAILERFPDATLESLADGSQVWAAEAVKEMCTDIHLTSVPGPNRPTINIYPYLTVGKMRVYAKDRLQWNPLLDYVWIDRMKREFPQVYEQLVKASI